MTLRILTFTTLFPDSTRPNHGIFVENRLRHLVASGAVRARVMAPVPWFSPDVAEVERRSGIAVHHPRWPAVPKLGMALAPVLLYQAARRALTRMMADGFQFDAIDAHYLYPDGVAAVWLARRFGKPVVLTARGSDVTLLPRYALPRGLIRMVLGRADALVGVSADLCRRMVALGADPAKVTMLRNGVDTKLFRPVDRMAARARLGISGQVLLSAGQLIPRKRHDLAIAALRHLPGAVLLIAGEGPERWRLEAQVVALGLSGRVRFLGALPHHELPHLYGAADALVLASAREGWANVLLESMACGTPVAASDIPGNDEVVRAPAAGRRFAAGDAGALAEAVRVLLDPAWDREATRAHAMRFGWDATTRGQLAILRRITSPVAMPCPARFQPDGLAQTIIASS